MSRNTGDLLQGTLGLLILKALAGGERHGYGIARWIQEITGDTLQIEEGSLYPGEVPAFSQVTLQTPLTGSAVRISGFAGFTPGCSRRNLP